MLPTQACRNPKASSLSDCVTCICSNGFLERTTSIQPFLEMSISADRESVRLRRERRPGHLFPYLNWHLLSDPVRATDRTNDDFDRRGSIHCDAPRGAVPYIFHFFHHPGRRFGDGGRTRTERGEGFCWSWESDLSGMGSDIQIQMDEERGRAWKGRLQYNALSTLRTQLHHSHP